MKRVYVAGPYSADNVITVLDNMRRGMRVSLEVFLAGFAPFSPWMDYHYQLQLKENEALSVKDYYEYSLAWLEVSDAILVLPNSENSKGVQAELVKAKELKIPIFFNLKDLIDYFRRLQ